MSRAGKFIPGGGAGKAGDALAAGRTGPIRAPEPGAPGGDPSSGKKGATKGLSLIKPVSKGQRLPIVIMSAAVCCLLVSFAWYEFAIIPAQRQAEIERKHIADMQAQLDAEKKAEADRLAALVAANAKARATLTVD